MFLRILGYQEDDHWVAHCLEMDIIGCGDSWDSAKAELFDAVAAHVSFAHFKNQPSLLWHPAPTWCFAAWERSTETSIRSLFNRTHDDYIPDFMTSPDPKDSTNGFQLAKVG